MKINLLNNKKSFCRGIEFNTDKWRLYYILNSEKVANEMALKCVKCWDHNPSIAYRCGKYFVPGAMTNYMLNNLKRYKWK